MGITRRQLLKRSATVAAGASLAPGMSFIPGTGVSWAAGPGDAIVVVIQLFGGNDGINTVYPLTGTQRATYEDYRPTLQLPDTNGALSPWINEGFDVSTVLDIGANADGSNYAFHPAMKPFHDLYQANKVAVVHGVHYPFPNHSHFRSEEIWYTGDPLGSDGQGWLGSYLNQAGFALADVPGVILGGEINPLFRPTDVGLFSFRSLSSLRYPAIGDTDFMQGKAEELFAQSAAANAALFPELVKIGQSGSSTLNKINEYYLEGNGLANAGKVEALLLDENGRYNRRNELVYDSPLNFDGDSFLASRRLTQEMRHVAATIRADVGARFFHAGRGGFDSHSNQEAGFFHSYLWREVAGAVAALYNELNQEVTLPPGYSGYRTENLADKLLIVTLSEFGRTMRQNSQNANTAGTDHAASAVQFAIGDAVIGGQYGAAPQLDDPRPDKDNDLKMVYDFRDLYGTVLDGWLNVPVSDIGPGPGKILPATPEVDGDGNSYTTYTPIGFL